MFMDKKMPNRNIAKQIKIAQMAKIYELRELRKMIIDHAEKIRDRPSQENNDNKGAGKHAAKNAKDPLEFIKGDPYESHENDDSNSK